MTCYTYDSFRNLLLLITYTDGTTPEQFTYNHLGQLTQVTDASGTRTISYNRYGEAETDALLAGTMTHTITEQRDTLGRSTGYTYAKNGIPQQQTSIGYGADGSIASAGFSHQGEHKEFTYTYLPGTHLLHTLTHPNGLTLTQSYDNARDLPTQMDYTRADALVVQRAYTYDILGRPTARDLARYGTETQDTFGYNTRSELTSAHVNSADYSYAYDAIGNRTAATEAGTRTAYTANKLNQYTAEGSFKPTFDADGNQTLIKTSTGTWNVTYNAKNRPVRFVNADETIVVECTYDTMGRRATKKVTTNGTLTEHRRFLYRGYLQIACCDLTRAYTPALWYILWDPTQETATRPLAIQKNGTWYTYGWDLTKNICETYRTDARIDLAYTYPPYGEVSPAHSYDQPLRWSSEYHDTELGLVYYNYRHYNPQMGRWMGRDMIGEKFDICLLRYGQNNPIYVLDILGLEPPSQVQNTDNGSVCCAKIKPRRIYISAIGTENRATPIPNPTIDDLVTSITQPIAQCECISELQIIAHADKEEFVLDSPFNNEGHKQTRESVNAKNAHDVFSRIKNKMCARCLIFLDSCHLGLGKIPQIVADTTNCTVRAALGFCAYSAAYPRWSKVRKNDYRHPTRYEEEAKNEFKYFYPSKIKA